MVIFSKLCDLFVSILSSLIALDYYLYSVCCLLALSISIILLKKVFGHG